MPLDLQVMARIGELDRHPARREIRRELAQDVHGDMLRVPIVITGLAQLPEGCLDEGVADGYERLEPHLMRDQDLRIVQRRKRARHLNL